MESFGQYKLLARLAVGGMGEVFVAKLLREGGFEKTLVLKRMLPELSARAGFVEMFSREARLSARLNHPNIIHIFDFGQVGESLFLAMEYVAGTDLGRLLGELGIRGEKLPLRLALRIASEACRGLDYAHRASDESGRSLKLVHRDISPSNILLSFEGEVKLTDFGLACPQHDLSLGHEMAGKLAYMPPEQLMGETLDRRSDLYSLGLVLYEMLVGTPAFTVKDAAPEPSRRPDFTPLETQPEALRALLMRATAFEKAERFGSAREFMEAIDAVAAALGPAPRGEELGVYLAARVPRQTTPGIVSEPARTIVSPRPATPALPPQAAPEAPQTKAARRKLPIAPLGITLLLLALASWALLSWQGRPATLNLITEPPGAEVRLNGTLNPARTPFTLSDLTPQAPQTLVLTLPGYEAATHTLRFEPGESRRLTHTFRRALRALRLTTTPPGARVTLNGVTQTAPTPFTSEPLALGRKHSLRLEKEGFVPLQTEFIIEEPGSEPFAQSYSLQAFYKQLTVVTTPAEAALYADGRRLAGRSPYALEGLIPDRPLHLVAAAKGYGALTRDVIPSQAANPLALTLRPFSAELELDADAGLNVQSGGRRFANGHALIASAEKKATILVLSPKQGAGKLVVRIQVAQSPDARGPQAVFNLDASPWGTLWLNQEPAQTTPVAGRKLSSGRHRLTFSLGGQGPRHTLYLTLRDAARPD